MVADQRLTPTYTADLAESLIAAVEGGVRGLLHVTNSGYCSWHEFTLAIMEIAGHRRAGRGGRDGASAGRRRPAPERRPDERARRVGGPADAPPWRDALEDYMAQTVTAAAPS